MTELIRKGKRRSRLTNRQANSGWSRVIAGRVFLPTRKSKESDKEKNGNWNFHLVSIRFRCLPVRAITERSKHNRCNDANSEVERILLPTPSPHRPPGRSPRP